MANVGGLAGCTPANHPSCSRAAEAQPPPHGKAGDSGAASPPQTPPLRKVSNDQPLFDDAAPATPTNV
jgi:hypothetical protein